MKSPGFLLSIAQRVLMIYGLFCALLTLASCGLNLFAGGAANQTAHPNSAPNQPNRIRIARLGVDSPIMPVGEDHYGAMAAPGAGHPASDPIWNTAFWWERGAAPGQPGNAVLAGHVDRSDGSHAIFWNLRQMQPGDHISITNQAGQTFTFRVTSIESFDNPDGGPTDPVIQRVFGPAPTANLNLISCYGAWVGTEFNRRLVVFSTLITDA
jgi:hypothetical protein